MSLAGSFIALENYVLNFTGNQAAAEAENQQAGSCAVGNR